MKNTYQKKLIDDINSKLADEEKIDAESLTPDQQAGFDYAISMLRDQTREVLMYRYRDGLTYREIGEKYRLTGSRIGQINQKALRILRSKYWRTIYTKGLAASADMIRERKEKEEKQERLWKLRFCKTREQVLKISTWTFGYRKGRALEQVGIKTIADLMQVVKDPDWYIKVDGIGKTSANRIENHLDYLWSDVCIEETDPRYGELLEVQNRIQCLNEK